VLLLLLLELLDKQPVSVLHPQLALVYSLAPAVLSEQVQPLQLAHLRLLHLVVLLAQVQHLRLVLGPVTRLVLRSEQVQPPVFLLPAILLKV
jgi:hypothetical protein